MKALLIAAIFMPAAALAQGPEGTWKTEKNDEGSFLHVEIAACNTDAAKLCGKITKVQAGPNATGEVPDLAGRYMIRDMLPDGENTWSGGTIWAPDDDETYRSKMSLSGSVLTVSGCVFGGLVCRGQDWTPVN